MVLHHKNHGQKEIVLTLYHRHEIEIHELTLSLTSNFGLFQTGRVCR